MVIASKSHISGEWKLGHKLPLVRDREHPVRQPDTAQVHEDAGASLDQAEGGHQLRGTRERTAEFRFEHAQDRGDESASVADADPEHGVDEEDTPVGQDA